MKFSCIALVALAACVQQATSYVHSNSPVVRFGGEEGLYNHDGGFSGNRISGGGLRPRENIYIHPFYKYYTAGYGRQQGINGFSNGGYLHGFRNLRHENLRVHPLLVREDETQPIIVDNVYINDHFLDNDNERFGNVAGMDSLDREMNGNSAVERVIVYSSADDDRESRSVRNNIGTGYGVEGYNARFGARSRAPITIGRNYVDVYGRGRNVGENDDVPIYVMDHDDREDSVVEERRNEAVFNSVAQNNDMEQFNRVGDVDDDDDDDDVTVIVPAVSDRENSVARQGSYGVRHNVDGFNGEYGTRRNIVYFRRNNDAEQGIRANMDDDVSQTNVARRRVGGYGLRSDIEGVTGGYGSRRNHAIVFGGHGNGLNHYNGGFFGVGRRNFDTNRYGAGHNGGNSFSSVIVRRRFGGNGRGVSGNGYGIDFDGENGNSGYGYRNAYRMGSYGNGLLGAGYPISRFGSSLTSGIWNIVRGVGL